MIKVTEINTRGMTCSELEMVRQFLVKNEVKKSVKGAKRNDRHSFKSASKEAKEIDFIKVSEYAIEEF